MRLTQIKLAGFKSFVDPTQLHVPSQLVGVVGPNGCGKSNIIDAVRWVLGESKAAELRGESMQDVIFNGSIGRKPASRSSVELVFDNSDGGLGGAWGRFAELAVKRILTRDGQSTYWINQQQVRRKDVYDLFMGTGLGPRAYAIIGQGMISRIIEARPEELRVFLEEAAGVSKYKERRRETEHRLNDARENLLRVEDIRQELDQQVVRLAQQAEVAQKYQSLVDERDTKRNLMLAARRAEAIIERDKMAAEAHQAQAELDRILAIVRGAESELEALRTQYDEGNSALHDAQGQLYEAVAETGRLEAEIRRIQDAHGRVQREIGAVQEQIAQSVRRVQELDHDLLQGDEDLAMAEVRASDGHADAASASDALLPLQQRQRELQITLGQARAAVTEVERRLALAAEQQRSADRQISQLTQRRERLLAERKGVQAPDETELAALRESLSYAQEEASMAREDIAMAEVGLSEAELSRAGHQRELDTERDRGQRVRAQLEALKEVQTRAVSDEALEAWLDKHSLGQKPRLWEKIRIDAGWETAVESVLEDRLAAVDVGRMSWAMGLLADPAPHKQTLLAPQMPGQGSDVQVPGLPVQMGAHALSQCIHGDDPAVVSVVRGWMFGVYCAKTRDEASALLNDLPPWASVVLPAGHRIDRSSVRMYAQDSPRAGLLARRQRIEDLERELKAQDLLVDDARRALASSEASVTHQRESLSRARRQLETASQQVHQLQLRETRMTEQFQAARQRTERLQAELEDVELADQEAQALRMDAEAAFEQADMDLAETQGRLEETQEQVDGIDAEMNQARERQRELERAAQTADFEARSLKERLERARRDLAEARHREGQSRQRLAELQAEGDELDDSIVREDLQIALDKRAEREAQVQQMRRDVDALAHQLRISDEARVSADRATQPLRDRINQLQLNEAQSRVQAEQFEQQLIEVGADLAALDLALATEAPRASWLQGEVTRLGNAIAALGAVNLAAMDELKAAEERRGFLASQSEDLQSAVGTLEDAIRKIDRETRALMQQTFDQVNSNFGQLFPKLFGGGDARLVLTGDELLDAGVQVHAQPPGKRNSTIHLLSGGEKALTAIALVFALFRLNPAPFCLLDEVDAPLDDPNTERFCNLVRMMSEQTQFLFISHNKIAMEMAQHLIGVTQQEQGVSRVVAVDLEAAADMVKEAA